MRQMAICVNCGKETRRCLCDDCREEVDIEQLCLDIISYKPGKMVDENNPESEKYMNRIWESIAEKLEYKSHLKSIVFELTDALEEIRKNYIRVRCIGGGSTVASYSRNWIYEKCKELLEHDRLSQYEKLVIKEILLRTYLGDALFFEADKLVGQLIQGEKIPLKNYITAGDFYTKTRRYDIAETIFCDGLRAYPHAFYLDSQREENNNRRPEIGKKRQYLPNTADKKIKYKEFMDSIQIDVSIAKKQVIAAKEYVKTTEVRDADFTDFVAYDIETTGFASYDSMVELGAIKVIGGNIIEEERFIFNEMNKPIKSVKMKKDAAKITGITDQDLKNAKPLTEVMPAFKAFIGDLVLVGFNNIAFDSKFLARAGRYGNTIIDNPQFDVMKYMEKFRDKLDIPKKGGTLDQLAEQLHVVNKHAHRAYEDAATTAKVFLKLKEMEGEAEEKKEDSLDDFLSDLDEW